MCERGDTRSREKDKYLSEQGFSLWSTIRAILTSPPLGRQKMPVSRCARLKNDRRGAKPGSTALLLSPSHPSRVLSPRSLASHNSSPLVSHPCSSLSLAQRRVVPTHKNRKKSPLPRRSNPRAASFSTVLFFGVQLAPPRLVRFTRGLCFVLL